MPVTLPAMSFPSTQLDGRESNPRHSYLTSVLLYGLFYVFSVRKRQGPGFVPQLFVVDHTHGTAHADEPSVRRSSIAHDADDRVFAVNARGVFAADSRGVFAGRCDCNRISSPVVFRMP